MNTAYALFGATIDKGLILDLRPATSNGGVKETLRVAYLSVFEEEGGLSSAVAIGFF